MCLYELQSFVISVNDCLLSHNVMIPLNIGLHNGICFLIIGGIVPDDICECLTMVLYWMTMLSENCAYNIVGCNSLNLEYRARRVLELTTSNDSDHETIIVVPPPMKYFPCHRPWSLG
jgi:hypothetical protein